MNFLRSFLGLPPELEVHPQVRGHFKRNFIVNTFDGVFWTLAESFVSVSAIMPVFASTLTDSAILIGLVPALIQAGWFIPQIFLAGYVNRLSRKLPFARSMAMVERLPYFLFPITAFLLHWVPKSVVIWIFMVVVALRGVASGMIALPWQEVVATIIPKPVRGRFFGVGRTLGRVFAVGGSAAAGLILAKVAYPNNFALSFLFGMFFMWVSYFFFAASIEPEPDVKEIEQPEPIEKPRFLDLPAFRQILEEDHNLRRYILSRIFFQMGSMAAGFYAVYGIQRFNLQDQQAAVFSGLLFASGIVGFMIWGVVGDRFGPRNILLVSDLAQTIVLILALIAPSIWVYYLIFIFYGFAQAGYMVGEMLMGMGLGPVSQRSLYIGLVRTVPGIFILVAPLIGGAIVQSIGYPVMFITALAFGIVGEALLLKVQYHDSPE